MKLPESDHHHDSPRRCVLDPLLLEKGIQRFGPKGMTELERRVTLFHLDREWSDHLAGVQDTRDSIHPVSLGGREPLDVFRRLVTDEFFKTQERVTEAAGEELRTLIENHAAIESDLERLKCPSSTRTYLIDENPFGIRAELRKGKNLYFSAAAVVYGPLSVLGVFLAKLFRKKR